MTESRHLLHPELFEQIPVTGERTAAFIAEQAGIVAARSIINTPAISVVIRTWNEGDALEELISDIRSQRLFSAPEIVVVDNESTDNTPDVAKASADEVVTIPFDEFTYSRSLNEGMRVASNDNVFMTVGHALLSTPNTLQAAINDLSQPNVAGAFARTLPGKNASTIEKLVSAGNIIYAKPAHESKVAKPRIANLGLFAAQNIAVSKEAWKELHGFDESYGSGGEDTDFAIRAIEDGLSIIEDQVLAVHHTHGLDLRNYAKQWIHWAKTLRAPREFDREEILARRPDLNR